MNNFSIPQNFIKEVHYSQKKILREAIKKIHWLYEKRSEKFLSKVPVNLFEAAEVYLEEVWKEDYEPVERALQMELSKFGNYLKNL